MNSIGIDFHKHFIRFAVLKESGKILKRVRILSEQQAINKFLSDIKDPIIALG